MKSITLPELPKDISPEIKEQKYIKYDIEKSELHSVEKVGDRLMKYQKYSETGFEKYYEVESKNETDEFEDDSDYEEESPELLKLDPYKWKSQDHYAVLGLSKLRINATDDDIKKAYRKKVLRHHPDKKASDGNTNNDSFFKCIQKAYEIVTDPVKRRQFDSVDPEFDESIPSKCTKEDFFEVLTPVFERNARFSNIQPVPSLGDMNSTREEVEEFYRFWSNFDSWRSFEYLDEEDADSYENREDRRYFERKNKNARAKYKKEDNQRIINLIDLAVRTDPRLALYKKADREAKEAKRLEKRAAQIAAANEEKKRKEEEERVKELAKKEEEERIAREKKEKETKKKILRKEKKTLKKFLQDNNYLIDPATPATPEQIENQLKKLDEYISQMDTDNLTAYRVYLLRAFENGWESASNYFNEDHLNEGEKYAAELAAMAPAEEIKEEVKEEIKTEKPEEEEKKEPEVEKVEIVEEEEKKETEVKKPEIAKMLKKLPSISRIGGMRRTKKKVIRKEYDSEEEEERERERELEKEKEEEQNAPAKSSKKKNKKKKKSKKKNSSEELKANVEETTTTTEENKEEVTPTTEDNTPSTEEIIEQPLDKEEVVPNNETEVSEEVKEETLIEESTKPAVPEEIKEDIAIEDSNQQVVNEVRGMYKVEPIYGVIPEIDTKTNMYTVKSIYGDDVDVDLPLTAEERSINTEEVSQEEKQEETTPIEESTEVVEEKQEETTPIEESTEVVEEKKEETTPIEESIEAVEEKKEEAAPIEVKSESKKSKKLRKRKSKAKLESTKPKEEKKEEKKVEKKEEKKPQEPVKPKEEILKEVKKQEEENAKRIKDILKKKISMGKLRSKKSSRKLREEKKEDEKEELTISFKDDKKKTKAEKKAEKEAKKEAKKIEEQKAQQEKNESSDKQVETPVNEEKIETPVEEPVNEEKTETPVEEPVNEEKIETPVEEPVNEEKTETPVEEPVNEEKTETQVDEPINEAPIELRGMYKVKPVYGDIPEIDTKTQMYTVKSIYGDNVIVDLPLTAGERVNGVEKETEVNEGKTEVSNEEPANEDITEAPIEKEEPISKEKTEIVEEITEDKTEVVEIDEEAEEVTEDKTEIEEEKTEEIPETKEKTEIIEVPSTNTETVNNTEEPVKEETNTPAKVLRRCPSGISLKPWTTEQQTKLEEALVKFPSSQFTENPMERWIEISNYVGRSRTDIKFRIKDLADAIRRKRSIQNLRKEN